MNNEFPKVIPPDPSKMTKDDIEILIKNLRDIELRAWGEEMAFTEEHLRSHIKVFPEGMGCIYSSDENALLYKPDAWILLEIILYNRKSVIKDWYQMSDNGYIKRTHTMFGNWLYGVNLSVPPKVPSKFTKMLLNFAKQKVIHFDLEGMIFGSRIPRYHKHSEIPVEKYVLLRKGKRYLDPELARYESYGFDVFGAKDKVPLIIDHYFEDPQSLNFGVIMVWNNNGGASL